MVSHTEMMTAPCRNLYEVNRVDVLPQAEEEAAEVPAETLTEAIEIESSKAE